MAAVLLGGGFCLWRAGNSVTEQFGSRYLGWPHLAFFFLTGVVFNYMASRLPRQGNRRAMGFFAAILVVGPAVSALLGAGASLIQSLLEARQERDTAGAGNSNLGMGTARKDFSDLLGFVYAPIAIMLSGTIYLTLGGQIGNIRVPADILPAAAAGLGLLLAEVALAETSAALAGGLPVLASWRNGLLGALPLKGSLAGIGLLLVLLYTRPNLLLPSEGSESPLGIVFIALIVLIPCGLLYYSYRLFLEMRQAYERTLRTLSGLVEARLSGRGGEAPSSGGRARQVGDWAALIAAHIGLPPAKAEQVRYAAYLLEVGKIGLPRTLLGRNDFVSPRQRKAYARHGELAAQILEPVEFLRPVASLIRYHQERYDGLGPANLRREAIPLGARILAVAQAFVEAREEGDGAGSAATALKQITANRGVRFDPKVVDALEAALAHQGLLPKTQAGRAPIYRSSRPATPTATPAEVSPSVGSHL